MIRFSAGVPIYLILDALDECPNTTGIPSSRDKVLELVEKLVNWNLPNLHLCITSRPEIDIRTSLEPLTSNRVSLHDQSGQKKDIVDYVNSVVYSDKNMRRWREEDKKVVIDVLSDRADGMWVRFHICRVPVSDAFTQVSLGILPTGNTTSLSSSQRAANSGGIAGDVGCDI